VGEPYVIVWDLDGTVGDFCALENQGDAVTPVRVAVRPGLSAALAELRREGFVHTVLTVATARYAELALHDTGLREHFALVEGRGQRGKGDAAGVGAALGVEADELPHRVLFVGDRLAFDEPQDARVLFHLEPWALSRPADELTRLVRHLRQAGGGSLAQGFARLAARRPWWQGFWPARSAPTPGVPVRRRLPGVGPVVLAARQSECPVIGFERPPRVPAPPEEFRFVPAELGARLPAR